MWTISKKFSFDAAHRLHGLPEGHQCGREHGHTYSITVFLRSDKLNKTGFVRDFGELKPIKEYIDNVLDHRHLNDVFPMHNTTVENMSKVLFEYFKELVPELYAIEMSETPKTTCRYEP